MIPRCAKLDEIQYLALSIARVNHDDDDDNDSDGLGYLPSSAFLGGGEGTFVSACLISVTLGSPGTPGSLNTSLKQTDRPTLALLFKRLLWIKEIPRLPLELSVLACNKKELKLNKARL